MLIYQTWTVSRPVLKDFMNYFVYPASKRYGWSCESGAAVVFWGDLSEESCGMSRTASATFIPVDSPSELAFWVLGLSGMFARWISPGLVRLTLTVLLWLLTVSVTLGSASELKVRVRLADGQITDELLEADSERDSITVEFKQGDGTLITFVADFKQVSWIMSPGWMFVWV